MNNFYFPLKPPSDQAIEVFNKVLKGNANADMRAIPNQWLLNERGLSAKLGEEIGQLRDALDQCRAELEMIKDEWYSPAHIDAVQKRTIEPQKKRIKQLEAALRRYGDHLYECSVGQPDEDCDCGFKQLLAGEPATEDSCTHQWIDPTNEVISANSHEICKECGLIRRLPSEISESNTRVPAEAKSPPAAGETPDQGAQPDAEPGAQSAGGS